MDGNYVIDWLKHYFNKPNLKEKELKPILHFSLLWNLFEHTYFENDKDRRLNPKSLINLSDISFQTSKDGELDDLFNFFKKRYLSDNGVKTNRYFDDLILDKKNGSPNNYDLCRDILLKSDPTKQEKLKIIFLIVHRFRNNLFHGRKYPETLNIYEKPFMKINTFLIHFIDTTAKNENINSTRFIRLDK